MKIQRKLINSLNLISIVLFLIPIFKLDLYQENYSTLSLSTRGYLYVLMLGVLIGSLLGLETSIITSKRNGILMFLSLLIGTVIPHHIPYNLQGNLHLLFAYIGFAGISILTILNIKEIKIKNIYFLCLFLSITFYLKCGMVNTISEVIVMISTIIINYYLYIKKENH